MLPAQLFTASADGIPNAAYLSHVEYVDASHVALSYQFFNKSKRNVAENPRALVLVSDPDTGQGWRLRLRFVRSETSGALFERMALRIEAIASYCGSRASSSCAPRTCIRCWRSSRRPRRGAAAPTRSAATGLPTRSSRCGRSRTSPSGSTAHSLEALVDQVLCGLEDSFGFKQSMILIPAENEGVMVTIATRGYPENGAGAEVRVGEGIAGVVAEARKPIRISGLVRGMLYALAMHRQAEAGSQRPSIQLPGLPSPQSQLGVPLLVRGELVGVRELRLDKSLQLPEWKDNLESRLLLLRRRLEQKCPEIRLAPLCRGRFALELTCPVSLATRP